MNTSTGEHITLLAPSKEVGLKEMPKDLNPCPRFNRIQDKTAARRAESHLKM
jgi:hypothetical protein